MAPVTTLVVETTEGVDLPLVIAGAGSRALAAALDVLFCALAMMVAGLLLLAATSFDSTGLSHFVFGLFGGGTLLLVVLYWFVFSLLQDGRTPGKALLGLRVRTLEGHPVGAERLFLRSLFLLVELLPVPLPIPLGLSFCLLSARGQRLGDVAAGTLVLRDPPRDPRAPSEKRGGRQPRPSSLALAPAMAARFGADDRSLLEAALRRRIEDPSARRRLARRLGEHYAARLGLSPPRNEAEARALFEELYLVLRERRRLAD